VALTHTLRSTLLPLSTTSAACSASKRSRPLRPATKRLVGWMRSHGDVRLVGVEGTGSYGAGLARHLTRVRIELVEVDRPNRQSRHRDGKSDPLDAVAGRCQMVCVRGSGSVP